MSSLPKCEGKISPSLRAVLSVRVKSHSLPETDAHGRLPSKIEKNSPGLSEKALTAKSDKKKAKTLFAL